MFKSIKILLSLSLFSEVLAIFSIPNKLHIIYKIAEHPLYPLFKKMLINTVPGQNPDAYFFSWRHTSTFIGDHKLAMVIQQSIW